MTNTQTTSIQKYLDSSLEVLKKFHLAPSRAESQLVVILNDVVSVDEAKVLAIAQTVKYSEDFNEMVRENISEMHVGERYSEINDLFTSIREDSKRLIRQEEDEKLDAGEKLENLWVSITRGSTHNRFNKIRSTYHAVSNDAKQQLNNEDAILNGYLDFRQALKSAEILSRQVFEQQTIKVEESRQALETAAKAVEEYKTSDSHKSELELKRDEAIREHEKQEKIYQLFKDVSEDLNQSYNVGETIIAKLKQTHNLKDQLYRGGVSFFGTNENIFTFLDATYTSQRGLHEQTRALEALENGTNKSLEDIAEFGGKIEEEAIRVGYGSTYKVESVKKLVDAIVSYQENSRKLIEEERNKSARSAKEIEVIVEEGKKRSIEIISRYEKKAA